LLDEDFFTLYHDLYIPAYSDYVATTTNKQIMILNESEAAFTHLLKYVLNEDADSNLRKVRGHIYRATLDCYKLTWEHINKSVSIIDEHREAYEGKESDLLKDLERMNLLLIEARTKECEGVGSENNDVLVSWKLAVEKAREIYYAINKSLLKKSIWKKKYLGPLYIIGVPAVFFIFGLVVQYLL